MLKIKMKCNLICLFSNLINKQILSKANYNKLRSKIKFRIKFKIKKIKTKEK